MADENVQPSAPDALKEPAAPVISPLSAEMAPQRNFTEERDAAVIPAARELLAALAGLEGLKMGSTALSSEESAGLYYQQQYVDVVVPVLRKHNLKLEHVTYLFQVMMQPIQLLNDITSNSLSMVRDIADAKKWGLESIDDLSVGDLDSFLVPAPASSVDKEGGTKAEAV